MICKLTVVVILVFAATTGSCFRLNLDRGKCSAPMDLVLLLQSSNVNPEYQNLTSLEYWSEVKSYAKDLVSRLEDISKTGTHVGIVTFSTNAVVNVKLNHYTATAVNTETIQRDIDVLPLLGGDNFIGRALEQTSSKMFTESAGMRTNASKVCIIVTTGISADWTVESAANLLKEKGVDIFAIGMGDDIEVMNLIMMASSPDNVWSSRIAAPVAKIVNEMKRKQCEESLKQVHRVLA